MNESVVFEYHFCFGDAIFDTSYLSFEVLGFISFFLKGNKIQMPITVHQVCHSTCSEHACSLSLSGRP